MIHKASTLILAAGAVLLVATTAQAVTFELVPTGGGNYDAIVTQEAGDPPIFAVDFFVQGSGQPAAELTFLNNNGNPYNEGTGNNDPDGEPGAILIGGSDVAGMCDNGPTLCFLDASCGGGTCVFGRTGAIKVGEISWNGSGTVSVGDSSAAVDGNLNELPKTNLTGCQRFNGEEVLAGDDVNQNGIVQGCECGDANGTGLFESADLLQLFGCLQTDSQANTLDCQQKLHNGDTQNSGAFESADLLASFNALNNASLGGGNTCPARPVAVP